LNHISVARPVPGPRWQLRREDWNGERCFFSSVPEGRLPPGYFTQGIKLHNNISDAATIGQEQRNKSYEASDEVLDRDSRGVPVGSQSWKMYPSTKQPWPIWWGKAGYGEDHPLHCSQSSYMPPSRSGLPKRPDFRRSYHLDNSM